MGQLDIAQLPLNTFYLVDYTYFYYDAIARAAT